MADQSLYNSTVQTAGTLALAHEKISRIKRLGTFENITGDCNNVTAVPTPLTVPRQNYGNKGRPSVRKIGDSWVLSFDVEPVRNDQGAIVQPWLIALLNAAKAVGAANLVDAQLFDAKDDALGATQGTYSVAVADLKTGFADEGGYKFTLTSDGNSVQQITSPIAGTGAPVIDSIPTPVGKAPGDLLVVRGFKLSGVISATIDAVPVVKISIIDDNTITLLIPAAVTGAAPVTVTNAIGVSNTANYTAA